MLKGASNMAVMIERVRPRGGIAEEPLYEANGFKMADPKYGSEMHHAKHAVHVKTLEEVADLIEKEGFSLWMTRRGKRASLICPTSLRVTHS